LHSFIDSIYVFGLQLSQIQGMKKEGTAGSESIYSRKIMLKN